MLSKKPLATKMLRKKIKVMISIAFLTTIAGCATSYDTSSLPNSQQASTRHAPSKPQEKDYIEPRNDEQQSTIPILRKNNAQQIFKDYGVNPTISTRNEQHSTFAMDVDTVSYQIAKANLESHQLPHKASVRVEEFINNFEYNYGSNGDIFSISAEVVPSPYRQGFHLLHIGVKAKHVDDKQRLPANLVLIADVSGSMLNDDKMALQKQAFTTLVSQLGSQDTVAIVAYNGSSRMLLKPTPANKKTKIYKAIKKMKAGGGTNVEQGLQHGYALAEKMAYPGHVNRVVLTSDGLANIGNVEPQQILKQINDFKQRNIFLTTVGVGKSMYNDYLLEQLANKGNGNYLYLANQADIERVFVDGLTTQLQTVAKDAKVQLKFNPEKVSLFRQIGYENRGLQTQDFLDASKDGGEVGANQQVTVLYEVKLTSHSNGDELATVALSYKKPQGSKVFTIDKSIPSSVVFSQTNAASSDTTIAMAVAAFAEKLRQSYWSRTYDYQQIQSELTRLPQYAKNSRQVSELRNLIYQAMRLDTRNDPYSDRLPLSHIDYDQVPLLR